MIRFTTGRWFAGTLPERLRLRAARMRARVALRSGWRTVYAARAFHADLVRAGLVR
jgi:hypothetical protein